MIPRTAVRTQAARDWARSGRELLRVGVWKSEGSKMQQGHKNASLMPPIGQMQ
jgi:hypothetical protein